MTVVMGIHYYYQPAIKNIQYQGAMNLRRKDSLLKTEPSLPQEYLDYCYEPRNFAITFDKPIVDKNTNPLYSHESFTKYFGKTELLVQHDLPERLLARKGQQGHASQQITKFNKLQEQLRRVKKNYPTQQIKNQLNTLETFIDTAKEHFKNLNIDDGISPRNSFSIKNLRLKDYLTQLNQPVVLPRTSRQHADVLEMRRRVHSENIVDYLKRQKIEARYFRVPKSLEIKEDRKSLDKDFRAVNRQLRQKTKYCHALYRPPFLQQRKLDEEIRSESKTYMMKLSHEEVSSVRNRQRTISCCL